MTITNPDVYAVECDVCEEEFPCRHTQDDAENTFVRYGGVIFSSLETREIIHVCETCVHTFTELEA